MLLKLIQPALAGPGIFDSDDSDSKALFQPLHGGQPQMSRRKFLLCSVALSGIGYVGIQSLREQLQKKKTEIDRLLGQENPPDQAYLRTAVESLLVTLGKFVFIKVGNVTGIPMGNAGTVGQPQLNLLTRTVLGPVIEELVFRELPGLLLGDGLLVGTLSSALFALAHNVGSDGFNYARIPANIFVGGIFYWYLMHHRGITHAMIGHIENNALAEVLSLLQKAMAPSHNRYRGSRL